MEHLAVSQANTAGSAPVGQQRATVSGDFEVFLQMLTAQMKYQDPLNPVDSTDYATQLATFSGVEQAVLTNDLLKGLQQQFAAGGLTELAGWVGKQARLEGNIPFAGAPMTLEFPAAPSAEAAQLEIRDAYGVLQQTLPVATGVTKVDWAGTYDDGTPFADGVYSIEVVSMARGAEIGRSFVATYRTIDEVRLQNGMPSVVFTDGASASANIVTALREA